jgi:hypothetical protein
VNLATRLRERQARRRPGGSGADLGDARRVSERVQQLAQFGRSAGDVDAPRVARCARGAQRAQPEAGDRARQLCEARGLQREPSRALDCRAAVVGAK